MSYSLKTTFWAAGQTTKQQILGPRCRNNVFSDNATSKYCLTIPHDASLFSLKERLRFSTAFEKKSRSVFKFLNNFRPLTGPIEKKLNRIRFFVTIS